MKHFLKICFLILFQIFFGQKSKVDLKIDQKIDSLKENRVENLVVFSQNCVGCFPKIMLKDKCNSNETQYLFWKKDLVSYQQKFDECIDYKAIKLENSKLVDLITTNYKQIKSEEIRPIEYKKGKHTIRQVVDHYSYNILKFIYKDDSFQKQIIDYQLETKMIDNKTPNQNYLYNQKTILKKVLDLVKKETY
ncbi:hypothetical protein GCM10010992_11340 [Cloacibacterium rupense]|uniref:Uncharacterized protein n=2 Tax=Cloacibacterium rupense TaxID=517423 RepID=A0ABQ2NHC4_9FLAO|nr:hypothetical protein GCM10010992_11340 [Cloacibacterium rupense]